MNEFEMAFFYGDYTELRLLAQAVLLENVEGSNTQEENFCLEQAD